VTRATYCLDTSILVKVLVPEEGSAEAAALLRRIVSGGYRLIAPAFAWAEVGTVLRKKARAGLLSESEASARWARFLSLSIDYIESGKRFPRSFRGRCEGLARHGRVLDC
jgi:predicted nucleic acid-binding protein